MAIEIVDIAIKNGDFHSYVGLPGGKTSLRSLFVDDHSHGGCWYRVSKVGDYFGILGQLRYLFEPRNGRCFLIYHLIHFLGPYTILVHFDLYIWLCRFLRKAGIAPCLHNFSREKTGVRQVDFWFSHIFIYQTPTLFVREKHGSCCLWSCSHRTLAITVLPALSRCPDEIGSQGWGSNVGKMQQRQAQIDRTLEDVVVSKQIFRSLFFGPTCPSWIE